MCRIFGFRSILQSGVHSSLIEADNAILKQSEKHPDGWGVAYFKMGAPHLIKMDRQAKDCGIFKHVSGVVSSGTVLAHIRLSTVGGDGPLNTHPFQYGKWVFCHNGTIRNFDAIREDLVAKIDGDLRAFIFGTTDSEVLFYLFLTVLRRHSFLEDFRYESERFATCLREFIDLVEEASGDLVPDVRDFDKNYMTFVITNGGFMMGFHGGQPLRVSTHKSKCPERNSCPHLAKVCENPGAAGEKVHHLLLSSEGILNENIWETLAFRDYVGVSEEMVLLKGHISKK